MRLRLLNRTVNHEQRMSFQRSYMHLYRLNDRAVAVIDGKIFDLGQTDWDMLINHDDLAAFLKHQATNSRELSAEVLDQITAPLKSQEVWAAGVTYYRSRTARMEESKDAGGGSFYDRVYSAPRPELFFKSTPHRVSGQNQDVRIRQDSQWNVPEPELALVVNSKGKIIGYTVGNDMSSRDIEGENPLYLPQAKVYDKCCGLGPGIFVSSSPLPPDTRILLEIRRKGELVFQGETNLTQLKRKPEELVEYLFRDNSFPQGCFLLTGTGIVPPDEFTLDHGDVISITIDSVGTLVNTVG